MPATISSAKRDGRDKAGQLSVLSCVGGSGAAGRTGQTPKGVVRLSRLAGLYLFRWNSHRGQGEPHNTGTWK
jgi:hypothetical protein